MATDPTIQLRIWITSKFRKRLIKGQTEDMQRNNLSLRFSIFAIEIKANNWFLYVVTTQLKSPKLNKLSKNITKEDDKLNTIEQDFEVFFFGLMILGNMYSIDNMKRLVENLCDISLQIRLSLKSGRRILS